MIPMEKRRAEIMRRIDEDPVREYSRCCGVEWGAHLALVVPEHMRKGVARYVILGIEGGSFQTAVFENDLLGAAGVADATNRERLFDWAMFLNSAAPSMSFGSRRHVREWIRSGGLIGNPKAEEEDGA